MRQDAEQQRLVRRAEVGENFRDVRRGKLAQHRAQGREVARRDVGLEFRPEQIPNRARDARAGKRERSNG